MEKETKKSVSKRSSSKKIAPARTPEAQEKLMINLSMKQAEKMLQEGRAPASIVVHFLRLATEKAKYENDKLQAEAEMARSKTDLMKSQKRSEELYEKAISAFRSYGGTSIIPENEEEEYYD